MLMMMAGYTIPGNYSSKEDPCPDRPLKLCLPAANGSGKDQYLIAGFAVWFAACGIRNRVIITSASHEQLKYQTEIYIRQLIQGANKAFGKLFDSVEFYHTCTRTGSEIKLFVTDESKRAEGFHPFTDGKMAIIINEAKSVPESIFDALARCTGYSYWLEISSPAGKSGHFYQVSLDAIHWPAKMELNRYYLRHISAYDCPHIPKSHIDYMKENKEPFWFDSSILALFSDYGDNVVISEALFEECFRSQVPTQDGTIGIGLDLAAGGDENSCYVRNGNHIVGALHFVQKNTEVTSPVIDEFLFPYKAFDYRFYADDGGIGRAIIDRLISLGWKIQRRLNQFPAFNKKEFRNLGAEDYFYLRRLVAKRLLVLSKKDPILVRQLTARYYDQKDGGRYQLESKSEARIRTKESPDRADAFVLCFRSFRPTDNKAPVEGKPSGMSLETFAQLYEWHKLPVRRPVYGRPTVLVKV